MKLSPAILSAGIALFSPHLSAEEVFVATVGMKQGPFAGEVAMKGFEGKVRAVAFSHELLTAIDPAGGPTGRRQHKPIVITKRVGASSPQFFQAWLTNEPLKSVTIDFTDTDGTVGTAASRRLVYQITLQNAVVVRIAQRLEPTATPTPATGPAHLEEISLAYQSITVTFHGPGGARTASDSMSTR
jgi:type VI secretion system secreted protein Hcp